MDGDGEGQCRGKREATVSGAVGAAGGVDAAAQGGERTMRRKGRGRRPT